MIKSRLLVATILLAAPMAANATTLIDGSFETKGSAAPVTTFCYDSPAGAQVRCAASPWVGGGVIKSGNAAWGGTTTSAGTYFGFIQGRSSVSQSFTATENGTGVFTWLDTNRGNLGALQSYSVKLISAGLTVELGTYTSQLGRFVARSTDSFALANGASYTLRFTGLAPVGADRTAFIDNVAITVTPSPVPEASTWMMLIVGFGFIGRANRRRGSALA